MSHQHILYWAACYLAAAFPFLIRLTAKTDRSQQQRQGLVSVVY